MIKFYYGGITMTDYQKMYYILCDAASKAIDAPHDEAKRLLREALNEAEEIYIQTCGENEEQEVNSRDLR